MLEILGSQRKSDDSHSARSSIAGLHQGLPGLGSLETIAISAHSPSVDRTLADVNLRARTGAAVLALQRADGTGVGVPSGRDRLAAGDVVTLSGTDQAIAHARRLLSGDLSEDSDYEEFADDDASGD